jgi:hypothetical protein
MKRRTDLGDSFDKNTPNIQSKALSLKGIEGGDFMAIMRRLLCKIGIHRPVDYAKQIYCLNMGSTNALEFNTKIYSKCQCGRKFYQWRRDHYLNDSKRCVPLKFETIERSMCNEW